MPVEVGEGVLEDRGDEESAVVGSEEVVGGDLDDVEVMVSVVAPPSVMIVFVTGFSVVVGIVLLVTVVASSLLLLPSDVVVVGRLVVGGAAEVLGTKVLVKFPLPTIFYQCHLCIHEYMIAGNSPRNVSAQKSRTQVS